MRRTSPTDTRAVPGSALGRGAAKERHVASLATESPPPVLAPSARRDERGATDDG